MLGQVVIGPVRDSPKLAPAEREQKFNIGGSLGVEAKLLRTVVTQAQVLLGHSERIQEVFAVTSPVLEPFQIRTGFAEKLQLHLLELTGPEGEVAGGNLIAERLTDLTDTERQLPSGGTLCVLELHKNALRGFRAQIDGAGGVLRNADKGLEHQIEFPDCRKIGRSAIRADNMVLLDVIVHLVVRPAGGIDVKPVFEGIILNQLVRTVTAAAHLAIHQRIGKAAEMSGCNPCLRIHNNRAVQSDVIFTFLYKLFPPCALDIVFEFHTERTVVPGIGKPAVNFGAGENKTAVFAQRHDFVHCLLCMIHSSLLLLYRSARTVFILFILSHTIRFVNSFSQFARLTKTKKCGILWWL